MSFGGSGNSGGGGSNVSRIGDLAYVVCDCHDDVYTGVAVCISGAASVYAESSNITRIGDIFISGCGHVTIAVSGSATVYAEGSNVSRIGDVVSACPKGIIISGASTVYAGN